jgi:small GTP-binding protein
MSVISKKICLLGDFGVGKTSLISRFVENKFSDRYLSTVGVKISRKLVNIQSEFNKLEINLLIWDVEGSTKFNSIAPSYLKGASGSIIVADLTRIETLENLASHIDLFLKINPQGSIAIALNKADLITSESLNNLICLYNFTSQQQVIANLPTSAKTGVNVNNLFDRLTIEMLHLDSFQF